MPKIRKKSPIPENADANITCDFGDGDISRSRESIATDSHIISSIIVRLRLHVSSVKKDTWLPSTLFGCLCVCVRACVRVCVCVYQILASFS